jgi:hypothetical protein
MKRALVLALALAACGKEAPPAPSSRDALIKAWKQAGLATTDFKAAQSPIGKDCQTGTVAKLEVVVCSFASADEAKAAQNLGLQWVGDTTGAAQAHGALVIAVADRHKADPSGKTINQILQAH